ncbi:MAG TPA: hypothetical protein VMB85_16680 [Bryobacteraceae bacterium]|nr:hypothetical protein [Bryobacteraceae bacterium]
MRVVRKGSELGTGRLNEAWLEIFVRELAHGPSSLSAAERVKLAAELADAAVKEISSRLEAKG